MSKHAQYKNC